MCTYELVDLASCELTTLCTWRHVYLFLSGHKTCVLMVGDMCTYSLVYSYYVNFCLRGLETCVLIVGDMCTYSLVYLE